MTQGAVEKIDKTPLYADGSDTTPGSDPNPTLWIVGKNSFQNHLLKYFLQNQIKLLCTIQTQTQWLGGQEMEVPDQGLVLFDCFGLTASELWIKVQMGGALDPLNCPTALFNVEREQEADFERSAIEKQLRGVFYVDDPPEYLPKGTEKMLQGELWYSRKTTSDILLERQKYTARSEMAQVMLTPREKEILVAIASGAGNNDIAGEFFISLHTVKTHIYNIYKKINVRNRLEATLWVARYL